MFVVSTRPMVASTQPDALAHASADHAYLSSSRTRKQRTTIKVSYVYAPNEHIRNRTQSART